jgi:hypothetical protein
MELLIVSLLLVATIGPIVMIGRWILGPTDRAAKFRDAPVRFSIGDFLCLFLAVQIPLTLIYQLVEQDEKPLFWLFTVITWVMAPVIWFACARALLKAGVTKAQHRFVFLGLIMPLVYYGLVPFVFLTVAGLVTLANTDAAELLLNKWLVLAWLALVCAFYVSGLFTRLIVRHALGNKPPISDLEHRLRLARAAIGEASESQGQFDTFGDA